jgi:methionine-rich copper-binding protein CopC
MKKLVLACAVFAVSAALAATALAASTFVKVSPASVKAGATVTVSGSVDHGCEVGKKGDVAELYSTAFKAKKGVGDLPTVDAPLKKKNGHFSIKVKIKKPLKKGKYEIGGRCGGGPFGHTKLNVTN